MSPQCLPLLLLALGLGAHCCHAEARPKLSPQDLQLHAFLCGNDSNSPCTNIYCSSTLEVSEAQTAEQSQAASALCGLQGQGAVFHGPDNGADFFMAARFGDPVTGVGPLGPDVGDVSTEANTPWMLADYAVSLTVQQKKLDSIKRIDGIAQVDLLLCSGPSCSTVADLQNILPFGTSNDTSVLAMGFSGMPLPETANGGANQTAAGVSTGTIRNQESIPQLEDVPQSWASKKLDNATIKKVQWRVNNASFIEMPKNQGLYPIQALQLLPIREIAFPGDGTLQGLQVGHYRARKLLFGSLARSNGRECVTIVWPLHPWLIERGWNSSDRGCVEKYQAMLADRKGPLPQVYLFDSYVPQAHVLLNPRLAGALGLWKSITVPNRYGGGFRPTYNISFLTGSPADLATPLFKEALPVIPDVTGRLSMTLGSEQYSATQEIDGCLTPCAESSRSRWANSSVAGRDCGRCDVLVVGTAVIAVREALPVRRGIDDVTKYYSAAIHKLQYYASFDPNDTDENLPWCTNWQKPLESANKMLYAEDLASNGSGAHVVLFANGSKTQNMTHAAEEASKGGILYNCSLLGSLSLGYVNRTWDKDGKIVPGCVGDVECVNSTTAFVQSLLWMSMEKRPGDEDVWPARAGIFPMQEGVIDPESIELGVQRVVQQAAGVLRKHATQELATTDATRSWLGALLDLSVTIVAIVAMASGLRDVHGWLHRWLFWAFGRWVHPHFLWVWVCKPLTAIIVLLGLFMVPLYILVSDKQSASGNVDGTSITVGWVAAKTDDKSSYMVVAAVAIRLVSRRDMHAYGLEMFNVILAGVASLAILLSLIFRLPFEPIDGAGSHKALPTSEPDDAVSAEKAPAVPSPGSEGPLPSPGAPSSDMTVNIPQTSERATGTACPCPWGV